MTGNIYHERLMDARADLQTTTTTLKLKYGCCYSKDRLTPEERKSHYLLDVAHLDLCASYAMYEKKMESMCARGLCGLKL